MNETETSTFDWRIWRWRIPAAIALWVCADIGALLLWVWNPPFIGSTYGRYNQIFELYSFSHTLALIGIGAILYSGCRKAKKLLFPIGAFLVLAFFYLTLFEHYARPSYDYGSWCNGMVSQLEHGDPYSTTTKPLYWYPPMLAQSMALTQRGLEAVFARGDTIASSHYNRTIARMGFYVFQCVQFALLIGTFWLTYLLCRDFKLDRRSAAIATSLLLLINVPLFRMFYFDQINLWLVNAILLVLLMRDRSAVVTGFAIALGFHIKLYPAILGLPLLLTRRWRPLFWAAGFALVIGFIQTEALTNIEVWTKFLGRISNPFYSGFFRDNSLHSVAKNILRLFGATEYSRHLMGVFQLIAIGWIGSRMARRELKLRDHCKATAPDVEWLSSFRFMEHAMDTIALSLLISPLVFEHHYTMAIPIILWTFVVWGEHAPRRIVIGSLLILIVPIYDVCPFSWNRIAGLLLLMSSRPVTIKSARPEWLSKCADFFRTQPGDAC